MFLISAHTRGNRGVHDTLKLCTFPAKYWVQAYSLVCAIPPLQAKGGLVTLAYRDHSMWYVVCPSLQSILNRNSRRGTCQQTPFHLQRRGHTRQTTDLKDDLLRSWGLHFCEHCWLQGLCQNTFVACICIS